ncbi:MAG: hypothetical protein KC503_31100 [Myxococcales bacterium]|nr:hypothetical protein [Myxococcales bacterium]
MRPVWALLLSRRGLLWLIAAAGAAVACCFVPLFARIAYPFALVMALVVPVAATHLGTRVVARARSGDDALLLTASPPRAMLALYGRAAAASLALLVLPLLIVTINAARVRTCDPLPGLLFLALMPLLGALAGAALGVIVALLLPRPALASALSLLLLLGSVGVSLWRFYATPAVFAYDPFVGYFPGAIYDPDVAVRAPLLWYRLHTTMWVAGALLLAARQLDPAALRLRWRPLPAARSWRLLGASLLALGLAATLFALRGRLAFAPDGADIRRELGGARHTEHFDIHFPRSLSPSVVDALVADHELRYAQLSALMKLRPPRIRSYVFASAEQKRRLMGAARTLIAKPWRREIYLTRSRFPQRALRHELAHIFAADWGDGLLGIALGTARFLGFIPVPVPNMGLVEGLAVAAEWPAAGESTPHQQALALVKLELAPPLRRLFGIGFYGFAGGRSYTYAGSFIRWLADTRGWPLVSKLYRSGGDFAGVYRRPLAKLAAEWRQFLRTKITLPDAQLQLARERFRQPGIFRRACPLVIANLRGDAADLEQKGQLRQATAVRERICRFEPGDPGNLFALMETLANAGETARALATAKRILGHRSTSKPLARKVHELSGDLQWLDGHEDQATAAYALAAKLAAGPGGRRLLALKRRALRWAKQPARARAAALLRDYLLPPRGEHRSGARDTNLAHELQAALPASSGLGYYLLSKQLEYRGLPREAAAMAQRALRRGLSHPDVIVEARWVLGRGSYHSGALFRAAAVFRALARDARAAGTRLRARDWYERAYFRLHGQLPSAAP